MSGWRFGGIAAFSLVVASLTLTGCDDFFVNQTASFGGSVAGQRGIVRVLFINNTSERASFTFGTYDQIDAESQPSFVQFGPNDFDSTLDGGTQSSIVVLDCARVFAIGSPQLLELINRNSNDARLVEEALVAGVEFFSVDGSEEPNDGERTLEGSATPFEALLGVDFPCEALLIIRFEPGSPDGEGGSTTFRIDFELIPSDSTR